jgi:hypothetical protein
VDVILVRAWALRRPFAETADRCRFQVLGVDLDPVTVRAWSRQGYKVRFGDVTESEFWSELPLTQARWIVLAVPYGTSRLTETDPRAAGCSWR